MTTVFRSARGESEVRQAYRDLIDTHLSFAERRTIETSAGETFVLSAGPLDAPAVVLLHGSGSVAASWAPEIAALATARRVHAVDLLGECGLSGSARLPLEPGRHALWLKEVTTSLDAGSATVVGTSLGGWVAVDYASTFPERVRATVLFSSSGFGPRRLAPLVVAGVLSTLGERGRRRALGLLLGPNPPAWSDEFHRALGALALRTFRHFKPRTDALPQFDDDRVRSLPPDLTAVFGAKDRMLDGAAAARRMRDLLPRTSVILLPDQGHLIPGQAQYLRGA
jgi:pimeloyl-ACP methyl ester carboxylesterase